MIPPSVHVPVLLLLMLTSTRTHALDFGNHGENILMQTDVEMVLITFDLEEASNLLNTLKTANRQLREAFLGNALAKVTSSNRKVHELNFDKLGVQIIDANGMRIDTVESHFHDLRLAASRPTSKRNKRAFEFLGEILSTVTGVPSARDHRKVVDQLLAIKHAVTEMGTVAKSTTTLHDKIPHVRGSYAQHHKQICKCQQTHRLS